MKFDRNRCTFIKGSSVSEIDDIPYEIDEENNVIISKDDFDAFIHREKTKFSSVVSDDTSFLSNASSSLAISEDEKLRNSLALQNSAFLGSAAQLTGKKNTSDESQISKTPPKSSDGEDAYVTFAPSFVASSPSPRLQKLKCVLDNQIEQLEMLLSTTSPSQSIENLIEEMINTEHENPKEEAHFTKSNVYAVPLDVADGREVKSNNKMNYRVDNPVRMKYVQPEKRSLLPDIPEDETVTADKKKEQNEIVSKGCAKIAKRFKKTIPFKIRSNYYVTGRK